MEAKTKPAAPTQDAHRDLSAVEEARARSHIADAAERQRTARGTIEYVSAPWLRRRGRQLHLIWIWIAQVAGAIWRRTADSHRWPGRWFSRVTLLRPTETISLWVVIWFALAVSSAMVAFQDPSSNAMRWAANWVLGGSVAALFTVLWHDVFKSPRTVRRVRRRIAAEPEALLRTTLAKPAAKIVELDPPVNTVPRDDLYDELLPGALARKKDVQIVVGDPGAGKTTALLDLASVLAKIGLVPVLLELRGEQASQDLFERARERFEKQVRPFVKTNSDADVIWRWACRRRRVAILVDDIDQIGSDGEPGFVMRRLLEEVATEGQAVIVTARPAGVPMGIAASAITIEQLDFDTAVDLAARPSLDVPGARTSAPPPRDEVRRWVREGKLADAPLYLEALAELTAVGACPDLPEDPRRWGGDERPGRWIERSETKRRWSPLWVRYMLLQRFYDGIVEGKVRRSLAIDPTDRQRSVEALQYAALGTLGAAGREAATAYGATSKESRRRRPRRTELAEFISTDDRRGLIEDGDGAQRERRDRVSQHEAIDTCERLRILEADWRGKPQFRHRILQAFLAGRCLAELGREESENRKKPQEKVEREGKAGPPKLDSFEGWLWALMDNHHPEKLTAHLTLAFAAIHADERSLKKPAKHWGGLADRIVGRLVDAVDPDVDGGKNGSVPVDELESRLELLDSTKAPDPHKRTDPDDDLIKLTTAADLASLLRHPRQDGARDGAAEVNAKRFEAALSGRWEPPRTDPFRRHERINELVRRTGGAMRWTKLRAVPAIANLGGKESWLTIWERFARDGDYDVRRAASRQLEKNARRAYPDLFDAIERHILEAGARSAEGEPLKPTDKQRERAGGSFVARKSFVALGWVLPAIVSGLSEELRGSAPAEAGADRPSTDAEEPSTDGADGKQGADAAFRRPETREECLNRARVQLIKFATLAFEGLRPELEDSLAQGFKADAMRHASARSAFKGPGWVASNRRLVADVGLPHATSWYARMLLYQALALYGIAGTNREDTLDMLSFRLHSTRERHPLTRRAAKLARRALRHAELKGSRWEAFIWSDDVEDAGRLPTVLSRGVGQLVGDVAVLVDLKGGSPPERQESFGHMEELPYCLSKSRDRHEILGSGCPPECGWGFCPYKAASPDEPNEHRGLSRGFCRGERRLVKPGTRPPAWQRSIGKRRLREFWEQMEYKARR